MAEKYLRIDANGLRQTSRAGGRFVDACEGVTSRIDRRHMTQQVIMLGQLMREAELSGLANLLDSERWANSSVSERQSTLISAVGMLLGFGSDVPPPAHLLAQAQAATPPANQQTVKADQNQPPAAQNEPAEPETVPETPPALPGDSVTSIDPHGNTATVERAPSMKPKIPGIKNLTNP